MSLAMSESAAVAVAKYKETTQASPEAFLRVKLMAGGCSGHEPKLTIDDQFDEKADSRYEYFGQTVVVDKKSELYLDDAVVNFIDGLERSGFQVNMPQAKKTCGCGSSVQF